MLSWNHKDIGDAFSLLIDLNQAFHGLGPADESNITKISEALNLFLQRLSPMIGDAVLKKRHPYGKAEILDDDKIISCSINGSDFFVSLKEIQQIIRSLDMLKAEIVGNRHCHFKVLGIQEDVEMNFQNDDQTAQRHDDTEYDKGADADTRPKRSKISVLKAKGIVVSGNESLFTTNQYQHISVEPLSPWAFIQLSGYFHDSDDDKPEFDQIGTVESLCHRNWRSLWELCKSVIVMFHAAFGDFSRLKICKTCRELFYEKRSDRKEFCGMPCRVKFNQAQEPAERRKCRMRQNAWITNRLAKLKSSKLPTTIGKDECDKCTTVPMKGGQCDLICQKNQVALSVKASSTKKI